MRISSCNLLQLKRTPLTGIGLRRPRLCGAGRHALSAIGNQYGVGVMYGAIISAGIFVFLSAGWFSKIKNFSTRGDRLTHHHHWLHADSGRLPRPGGGDATAKNFGDPKMLLVGFLTMGIILGLNAFAMGFQVLAILAGILIGTHRRCHGHGLARNGRQLVPPASIFYFGTPKFEWSSITMILVS